MKTYLILSLLLIGYCATPSITADVKSISTADVCSPLVVAHRGSSGYVTEHTLGAYALAVTMGADYIEPDLVMTRDGHLIAQHDNQLGLATDVAERPEFASRHRSQSVDGRILTGWFTEDFTLAEIKTLRAIERMPTMRPGNARMDYSHDVPTLQEIIDLAKSMQGIYCREIGIYTEIKHATHFQQLGLAMEQPIVDMFHSNGYQGPESPVFIQSFEVSNLQQLKNMTDLRLVQLYGGSQSRPFDQTVLGTDLTYGAMATAEGLREVATYAYGVGPDKSYIIPRVAGALGEVTDFVVNAHAAGLKVHPYTFRSENAFLPVEFRSNDTSPAAIGDIQGELRAFLDTGIDGLFIDQPDAIVQLRNPCIIENPECQFRRSSALQLKSAVWFNILALLIISFLFFKR